MIRKICLSLFFAGFLALGLCIFLHPVREKSMEENRQLQTFPETSAARVFSGEFESEFENFLSDQFPERNLFMGLATGLKKAEGKRDLQDTYLGRDHYFFEKVLDSDLTRKQMESNVGVLSQLADRHQEVEFSAMLVPSSGISLPDYLPGGAKVYDAGKLYEMAKENLGRVKLVNPSQALYGDPANYYRTDHHWTALGAYRAYQVLMEGQGAYQRDLPEPVSQDFLGTLYSKTQDASAVADSIVLPQVDEGIQVKVDGEEQSLYDMAALDRKDQYEVYLGGNFGLVEIQNPGAKGGCLLVIKDSFFNSIAPYLTADYEKIVLVDPRFFPGMWESLFESYKPDRVLALYELNNFAVDQNLVKLLM